MVAEGHARRVPSAPRVGFHVYTVDRGGRLCNRSFPVPAAARAAGGVLCRGAAVKASFVAWGSRSPPHGGGGARLRGRQLSHEGRRPLSPRAATSAFSRRRTSGLLELTALAPRFSGRRLGRGPTRAALLGLQLQTQTVARRGPHDCASQFLQDIS